MKSKTTNTKSPAPKGAINRLASVRAVFAALALTVALAASSAAQKGEGEQPASGKNQIAPRAELQQAYRPAPRDPFKRFVQPKEQSKRLATKQQAARLVGFPSLEARRSEFRRAVEMAVAADRPEPDPLSQYLVSEIEVTGIFRDDRGPGAFVKAMPTGTMFFVRGGARVYNGELLRIESNDGGAGPSQVTFREVSYIEQNGKQSPQEKVVTKVPTVTPVKK
jgi:hypothetical protein